MKNNTNNQNLISLYNKTRENFKDLDKYYNECEFLQFYHPENTRESGAFSIAEDNFRYYLGIALTSLRILMDAMNLHQTLFVFNEEQKKIQSDCSGKLTEMRMHHILDVTTNDKHIFLHKYFDLISSYVDAKFENNELSMLKSILENTGKLIMDRDLNPSNESEITNSVLNVLSLVFPDATGNVNINQVLSTYKPDIGLRSLNVAIEYKFADNKNEVKKALGGIYEDMKVYSGSRDWTKFYTVLYMTDNYFSKNQILHDFKYVGDNNSWTPIVVVGKGQRKRKK